MRQGWRLCMLAAMLAPSAMAADGAYLDRRVEREGIALHVRIESAADATDGARGTAAPAAQPRAGDHVRLSVDVERLADGQALGNLPIGVWLDREVSVGSGIVPACGQRVASILSGDLLQRPLLDLTGYYVLTLDAEGSVSVLDPAVSFAGRSSLYTAVQLGGRPFDWVKTADDRWLFVALPEQREVVAIDLQQFKVRQRIRVAGRPTRLALQPDGQALWIAQRGGDATAADAAATDSTAAAADDRIDIYALADARVTGGRALPRGHHEIAFSDDGRYAYVGSRDSGRISVIDSADGRLLREVELGGQPLSLLSLPAQSQVWAVDGAQGVIHRLSRGGGPIDRIALDVGLGPARVTPDGRHVLVVNPAQHRLYVLDAADGSLKHALTVSGRPYDLFFSERYAYVRPLDIEQVAMFSLASLGLDAAPTPQYLPMGAQAIGAFPDLPVASSMSPNMERSGAFVAAPGERTIYHYMEGMNAPDSSLRTYGHTPMAVAISLRGLREYGRGRYSTTFRLPSQGRMVLALATESPRVRECVAWDVSPAPETADARGWSLRWLGAARQRVRRGEVAEFAVKLDASAGRPTPAASALEAWIVPGAGGLAERWPLLATQRPGEYRIRGQLAQAGGYFVHVHETGRARARLDDVPASLIVE